MTTALGNDATQKVAGREPLLVFLEPNYAEEVRKRLSANLLLR